LGTEAGEPILSGGLQAAAALGWETPTSPSSCPSSAVDFRRAGTDFVVPRWDADVIPGNGSTGTVSGRVVHTKFNEAAVMQAMPGARILPLHTADLMTDEQAYNTPERCGPWVLTHSQSEICTSGLPRRRLQRRP
jgi:hypothetical protein